MSLYVRFRYNAYLAGGNGYASESSPVIDVYLTHHLAGDKIACVNVTGNEESEHSITLALEPIDEAVAIAREQLVPSDAVNLRLAVGQLPSSSALVFNAYADTLSDQGLWGRARVGSVVIPLASVVTDSWYAVVQNTGDEGDIAKGRLMLTAFEWRDVSPSFVSVPPEADLLKPIKRSMDVFFGTNAEFGRPTYAYLSRIHCPEYRTPFGSLPGSAYALRIPRGAPNQRVYERLLRIALRRGDLKVDSVLEFARKQFQSSAVKILPEFVSVTQLLARMLSIIPTAIAYLDDFVNTAGDSLLKDKQGKWQRAGPKGHMTVSEDFKVARRTYAGDCEDVADESRIEMEMLRRFNQFVDTTIDVSTGKLAELLVEMQRLCELYVMTMILADVTNKKLEAQVVQQSDAMAHTFACLIPRKLFCDRMRASRAVDEATVQSMRKERLVDVRPWEDGLEILVCEGTAPIDPMLRPQQNYYPDKLDLVTVERRIVARRELARDLFTSGRVDLRGMQTETFQEFTRSTGRDYSLFYKAVVSLYTADFRQHRVLDFVFVLQRENTYGIRFNEMLDKQDTFVLVPYMKLTDGEAATLDDVLMMLEPIPPLALPDDDDEQERRVRALAEPLFALAKQNPVRESTRIGRSGVPLMPSKVVLSFRSVDFTAEQAKKLTAYVREELATGRISTLRVTYEALLATPVCGDVMTSLGVLDVELFV